MKRLWIKSRFYFWRTVVDQVVWAGFFGSWLHTRALFGFLVALEDGMDSGWLSAPQMVDHFCEMQGPDE